MTATDLEITPDLTMEEILRRVPAAQRALFQRYHVGGCSSCGFEPTDTLAKVCTDHNLLDVPGVVQTIVLAHEADQKMKVEPETLREWLASGEKMRLFDTRMPEEREAMEFPEAEPLDYDNSEAYMQLPKDTKLVFACQDGDRSLDVTSYFIGHGFTAAYSLKGGLDALRRS